MAIEWKEEYDVGVEIFNEQHKGLFKIINKLYEAINSQKPGSDLDGVLGGTNTLKIVRIGEINLADNKKKNTVG